MTTETKVPALEKSITAIANTGANEKLLDVKLFVKDTATDEAVVAYEFAQAVTARRAGNVAHEADSPERVESVDILTEFPDLLSK